MAIIVCHKETNKRYMLLGTGLGAFKAVRPSLFGGNLIPHEEEGNIKMVSVCDIKGNINWFYSNNLRVLQVDGVNISEFSILNEDNKNQNEQDIEICPGCGNRVSLDKTTCDQCGLTLVDNTYKEISDLAKKMKR